MTYAENCPENGPNENALDQRPHCPPLSKESLTLALRLRLGSRPASEHESDLVHEVGKVVDNVEESLVHRSKQVAIVIAQRVDGPTSCNDHTHVVEGVFHSSRAVSSNAACLALEDLEEDVAP